MGLALSRIHDGRFVTANKKFVEYVGWSEDELLDRSWMDLTSPDTKRKTPGSTPNSCTTADMVPTAKNWFIAASLWCR